jgi:hypothetical protein
MARLDLAAERFAAALDALEQTTLPLAGARDKQADTAARLAAVSEERDRLLLRIAELEDEARALSGLTEEMEGRLDGAIAEIRTALGR